MANNLEDYCIQKSYQENDLLKLYKNDKSVQNNSFSCGFYCMHFIEHMLKGLSFNKYLKRFTQVY